MEQSIPAAAGTGATVLLVDDEPIVREVVATYLRREGYRALEAGDGITARNLIERAQPELVVLDVMLPGIDGLELCRWIRARSDVPVIMLTARGEEADRIAGLDLGADDYLAKPFNFAELLARVRALLRRSPKMAPTQLQCCDLVLDPATRRVRRADKEIDLTPREYALLEFLLRRAGTVVTRAALIEGIWDMNFDSLTNVLEVLVNRLRAKVDYGFSKRLIHTVRSVGYVLSEEPR